MIKVELFMNTCTWDTKRWVNVGNFLEKLSEIEALHYIVCTTRCL